MGDEDNLQIAALALQKGVAPNREWLIIGFAERPLSGEIPVRIPGFAEVLINFQLTGPLHHVAESSLVVTPVLSQASLKILTNSYVEPTQDTSSSTPLVENTIGSDSAVELIGAWVFDSDPSSGHTVIDSSGNNNHMALSPLGTTEVSGRVESAREFSGGYGVIALRSHSIAPQFSLTGWIKPNSYPRGEDIAVIFSTISLTSTGWFTGIDGSGHLRFGWGVGESRFLVSPDKLPIGRWSHFAVTFNPTTGRVALFINGEQSTTGIVPADTDVNGYWSAIATVGRATWVDGFYFSGALDEMKLYRRVLTASQVKAAFDTAPVGAPMAPSEPIAKWTFDDPIYGIADIVNDDSGFGNDARLSWGGTVSAEGRIGWARQFQGGWATVESLAGAITSSFSVSLWICPEVYAPAGRLAVIYGASSGNRDGWIVALDDLGRILLATGAGGPDAEVRSVTRLQSGQWRRIDVTYDATRNLGKIYVDGSLDSLGLVTIDFTSRVAPTIGNASWETDWQFHGVLDELAVYDSALQSEEVAELSVQDSVRAKMYRPELIVRTAEEFRRVIADGVEPGSIVRLAPGDYFGPFPSRSRDKALRGEARQPILVTALVPSSRPVIHWQNSWLGALRYVEFRDLDFTGRVNIDGSADPSGPRNYGVSFRRVRWSLCGWGGQAECLKVTKGDAMTVEDVTFFAVQAYRAGINALSASDRMRLSLFTLEEVDKRVAVGKDLGRSTDMPIDFVAVNDSLIRSVQMETGGTHASIQIKGGSSANVIENNTLSAWAIPKKRMVRRNINLAGGTCDLCFRAEGFREFEAYNTVVRGNRIECGDACGAIATQIGTQWSNNTHSMLGGLGNCDAAAGEPASRWAIRLTNEASADHVDEVRPSQNAVFSKNVWVYRKCSSSAEFVNRGVVCAPDTDVTAAGQDCVATKTMRWKDNVVYQLDWDARIMFEVNPWDANLRVRHCHPTVTGVARDWDTGTSAGLGDISGQCEGRQGENGIDPGLIDSGLPSMRITSEFYELLGIGANAMFPARVCDNTGSEHRCSAID